MRSSNLTNALEAAWTSIQKHFPETPDCVMVVAPVSKNGTYTKYGHYAESRWTVQSAAAEQTWADGEEAWYAGRRQEALAIVAEVLAFSGTAAPEVLISAEGLDRDARQVFRTVLHESVHGIAAARGVKDTSRGGRYHNKAFAAIASEVGLVVEKEPRIGHVTPDLTDETADLYSAEIDAIGAALTMHRSCEGARTMKVVGGASRNGLALICGCETPRKIRMAESVLDLGPVICGICEEEFRPEGLGIEGGAASNVDLAAFLKGVLAAETEA